MNRPKWIVRTGLGQDSHRFIPKNSAKPCILGGVIFEDCPGFIANSDGDVVFHSICNAISSLSHGIILGCRADEMLVKDGITDSSMYLKEAVNSLKDQEITHVSISIEAARPKLLKKLPEMRASIANILGININLVGITATTGEGLTDFGCGDGLQCFCIVTTMEYIAEE